MMRRHEIQVLRDDRPMPRYRVLLRSTLLTAGSSSTRRTVRSEVPASPRHLDLRVAGSRLAPWVMGRHSPQSRE